MTLRAQAMSGWRWGSVRTVKVYIQDGLAVHGSLRLTALESSGVKDRSEAVVEDGPV